MSSLREIIKEMAPEDEEIVPTEVCLLLKYQNTV
jgi:hypothetical protein